MDLYYVVKVDNLVVDVGVGWNIWECDWDLGGR